MNHLPDLEYIVNNELFIICDLLSTDSFISFCKDRGVRVSREKLEQYEKLGLFYPFARVRYPRIKIKIERIDDHQIKHHGTLKEGEVWHGELKEDYSHFCFEKKFALDWLKHDHLWEPSTKAFAPWVTFVDNNGQTEIESFYSIFQVYNLNFISNSTKLSLGAEWWYQYTQNEIDGLVIQITDWARGAIDCLKDAGPRSITPLLCQILSNRFYPETQTDRRHITLSSSSHYHKWDWYEYCRNWSAQKICAALDFDADLIKKLHEIAVSDVRQLDPLSEWYELVCFVNVERKAKLKGNALLAQTFYSIEHMLRLFYEDLTGEKLCPPDESRGWNKDMWYGEGVANNDLLFLEFLTNKYGLNPRPQLILIVEGNGELNQFPRISEELMGYSFSKLGIEVINIQGIGNFEGKKGIDRCGALGRFIDDCHHRQTFVFVVLDDEGGVAKIKNKLIKGQSQYNPGRTITNNEYIHIWNTNIEFDNFNHSEISQAMTALCESRYIFTVDELKECEKQFIKHRSDTLSKLYKERLGYCLDKPSLLSLLVDNILSNPQDEFSEGKGKRPIIRLVQKLIELASRNYRPTSMKTWKKNQESGYLGEVRNNLHNSQQSD